LLVRRLKYGQAFTLVVPPEAIAVAALASHPEPTTLSLLQLPQTRA
jgi:hypothetical protein